MRFGNIFMEATKNSDDKITAKDSTNHLSNLGFYFDWKSTLNFRSKEKYLMEIDMFKNTFKDIEIDRMMMSLG